MEKILRPQILDLDPKAFGASASFKHWLSCWKSYVEVTAVINTDTLRLKALTATVSGRVYSMFSSLTTYDAAITRLEEQYTFQENVVYARHLLATRRQLPGESVQDFARTLRNIIQRCGCQAVDAATYEDELMRDALVTGLSSKQARTRLLEQKALTFDQAIQSAAAVVSAIDKADEYSIPAVSTQPDLHPWQPSRAAALVAAPADPGLIMVAATDKTSPHGLKCFFCGQDRHPRYLCPARSAVCSSCKKTGHYSKVCKSAAKPARRNLGAVFEPQVRELTLSPPRPQRPGRTSPPPTRPTLASCTRRWVPPSCHPAASCATRPPPSCVTQTPPPSWVMQSPPSGTPPPPSRISRPTASPTARDANDCPTCPHPFPAPTLASCALNQDGPHSLSLSTTQLLINGHPTKGLLDSGSTESFIHPDLVGRLNLTTRPSRQEIALASHARTATVEGYCTVTLGINGATFTDFRLYVLPQLCAPVLLGLDFQANMRSVTMVYGGPLPPLTIGGGPSQTCGLASLKVEPPSLFANLTPDCRPIATRSRRYSAADRDFTKAEVARLLKEGVIAESNSPWRAQVLIVRTGSKPRMVIDYSQTVNRFTRLDAYPLPRIADMVTQIAQYRVFSTIDLRSAYHQLPMRKEDRQYTAFEAAGRLFHFLRVPFGVTNGVSVFQRTMDQMVSKFNLPATYPYLDNVTICGHDQQDHDANLAKFLQVAKRLNLTYNEDKCSFRTTRLAILGYVIENGVLGPDPERMRPLQELPLPESMKALKRCLGLFAYYAQWVPQYADKARPLLKATTFPLEAEARQAFVAIKNDIAKAAMHAIDESLPFQVESDASDFALGATLNQADRPVAFFSRTLQGPETRHSSVEKEAQAIVEAVRHWRHYLAAKRFTLVTDQRSVAFMFDNKQRGKIKNDKILRWRIELSSFEYDILYRPGKFNDPPDALSRGTCASVQSDKLRNLHDLLCHPGVTRLAHFIRSKNLPYSLEEVKTMTQECSVCAECKPRFFRPDQAHLVRSTRPFERLSIDFKGPLPSNNRNTYILTAIDEYSRYPFAFPCADMTTTTVIRCLTAIFSLFGLPNYVHSDRGSSFMSDELRRFLLGKGIATSRTTSYNPRGNGQVERENGTIWRAITLALKSRGLPIARWQEVLHDALHATRSLLCTATNKTPHDAMFCFPRRSTSGTALPQWLTSPGPVLLKRHVRGQKTEPLVDRVHLLHANPQYAYIQYPDGHEDTVSVRDLAPAGAAPPLTAPADPAYATVPLVYQQLPLTQLIQHDSGYQRPQQYDYNRHLGPTLQSPSHENVPNLPPATEPVRQPTSPAPALRQSTRQSRPPDRLQYERT